MSDQGRDWRRILHDGELQLTPAQQARHDAFDAAAAPILAELRAAGIETEDFGTFTSLYPLSIDFGLAAPILIRWLPRIDEPNVIEAIARSLTGERVARGEGAKQLIVAFRRLPASDSSVGWAIGNALSTLAGPADADDILELLTDRRYGTARQMLCDALTRTRDPRAAETMVELIDDDDVNGHAILALRRLGNWKVIPLADRARPKLEALLAQPGWEQELRRKQARKALATMDRAD